MSCNENSGVSTPGVHSSDPPSRCKRRNSRSPSQDGGRDLHGGADSPFGSEDVHPWWAKTCLPSLFPTCPGTCMPGSVVSKELLRQMNNNVQDNIVWPWGWISYSYSSCHDPTIPGFAWLGPDIPAGTGERLWEASTTQGCLLSTCPSCELPNFPCKGFAQLGHTCVHLQTEISFGFHMSLLRPTWTNSCGKNNNWKAAWETMSPFCCCLAFWHALSAFWIRGHLMHCNAIAIQTG